MPTLQLAVDNRQAVQAFKEFTAVTDNNAKELEKFKKRLIDTEDTTKKLTAGLDLAKTAVLGLFAAFSVRGLYSLIKDTADYADNLGDLSKRLGVTTEFLSTMGFAATQSGTTLENLATGVKFLEKGLNDFAVNGDQAIGKVIKVLGTDFAEAVKKGDSIESLFFRLSRRFKELSQQERVFVGLELFGRGGTEIIPVLLEDLDELDQQVRKTGASVGSDFVKKGDDFNDALGRMRISFIGLRNNAIAPLLPLLTEMIDKFAEFVTKNKAGILSFLSETAEKSAQAAVEITKFIAAFSSSRALEHETSKEKEDIQTQLEGLHGERRDLQKPLPPGDSLFYGRDRTKEDIEKFRSERLKFVEAEIKRLQSLFEAKSDLLRLAMAQTDATKIDFSASEKIKQTAKDIKESQGSQKPASEGAQLDRTNLEAAKAADAAAKAQEKLNDVRDRAREKVSDIISKTQMEIELLDVSKDSRDAARAAMEFENAVRQAGLGRIEEQIAAGKQLIETLDRETKKRDELEKKAKDENEVKKNYDQYIQNLKTELSTIGEIADAREKALAVAEQENQARDRNVELTQKQREELLQNIDAIQKAKIIKNIADGIGDAFGDLVIGLTEQTASIKDTLLSFVNAIRRAIQEELLVKPLAQGISRGIFNLVTSIAGGAAASGAGANNPGLGQTTDIHARYGMQLGAPTALAYGGNVFDRPTRFSYGGRGYQSGEAGPEMTVFPIERDSYGRLGLRNAGDSGNKVVNVKVVTPNPDGFRKSKNQIMREIRKGLS